MCFRFFMFTVPDENLVIWLSVSSLFLSIFSQLMANDIILFVEYTSVYRYE